MFYVTGTNIRYVQISNEVDMRVGMDKTLVQYSTRANQRVQSLSISILKIMNMYKGKHNDRAVFQK